MVNEGQVMDAILNFEKMAKGAEKMLNNEVVKNSPFLLQMFTNWKIKCEARAQVLKWVVGIDYLKYETPDFNLSDHPNK